jgi:predicted enzyme related to lactoylglutathione lyase
MAGSEEEAAVMRHATNWFELPVTDLDRAKAFYSAILGTALSEIAEADDRRFAMFPAEDGVSGAIVLGEGYVPSREGALIFLNAGDELEPAVNRVEAAGGRVLLPRMDMDEWGVAAFIVDSEGNKVALHAAA